MTVGVGMIGTFSGFVAAWFLAPQAKQQDTEIESVRLEISKIRELLEKETRRE